MSVTDSDREIINTLSQRLALIEIKVSVLSLLSWAALIMAVVLGVAAVLIAQG